MGKVAWMGLRKCERANPPPHPPIPPHLPAGADGVVAVKFGAAVVGDVEKNMVATALPGRERAKSRQRQSFPHVAAVHLIGHARAGKEQSEPATHPHHTTKTSTENMEFDVFHQLLSPASVVTLFSDYAAMPAGRSNHRPLHNNNYYIDLHSLLTP